MEHPKSGLNRGKEGSIGKVCNRLPADRQHKKARKNKKNVNENLNQNEGRKQDGMATETKAIEITIVGDSPLRFLNTEKILNNYCTVNKEFKLGMKIREAIQETGKIIVTSSL